nr:ABC transporter substrate-binding protein [Atopomonas sediminilitoris]
MAWDLLREVFNGVTEIQPHSMPYTRSVGLVLQGRQHAWIGSYLNEEPQALYPHWPFDADRLGALALRSKAITSLQALTGQRVGSLHGYRMDQYLPVLMRYQEFPRTTGVLNMLLRDRLDAYIDGMAEVGEILATAKPESAAQLQVHEVAQVPLYVAFADTQEGHALRDYYDQRMAQLYAEGVIKQVYQRWDWPYAPFVKVVPQGD